MMTALAQFAGSHFTRRAILASGVALAAMPAFAAKLPLTPVVETRDSLTLAIKDLSPRFLDFYAAAHDAAPDARFALWQDRYGFAAVPPTLPRQRVT